MLQPRQSDFILKFGEREFTVDFGADIRHALKPVHKTPKELEELKNMIEEHHKDNERLMAEKGM